MTAADTQLLITSATPIIVAICGAITAIYAAQAHKAATAGLAQGQVNATKIDTVQGTVDGAAHALASNLTATQTKNEDLIRSLAANTTPPPPISPP